MLVMFKVNNDTKIKQTEVLIFIIKSLLAR